MTAVPGMSTSLAAKPGERLPGGSLLASRVLLDEQSAALAGRIEAAFLAEAVARWLSLRSVILFRATLNPTAAGRVYSASDARPERMAPRLWQMHQAAGPAAGMARSISGKRFSFSW
jgi:hypothetical protein